MINLNLLNMFSVCGLFPPAVHHHPEPAGGPHCGRHQDLPGWCRPQEVDDAGTVYESVHCTICVTYLSDWDVLLNCKGCLGVVEDVLSKWLGCVAKWALLEIDIEK